MSQNGTIGTITKAGQNDDCVYVIWQTRDPSKTWYVNTKIDEKIIRCRLISLIDRRPHQVNSGFTQDAWSYEIIDEKTFLGIAGGYAPLPVRE
jgi:hypothetical protein